MAGLIPMPHVHAHTTQPLKLRSLALAAAARSQLVTRRCKMTFKIPFGHNSFAKWNLTFCKQSFILILACGCAISSCHMLAHVLQVYYGRHFGFYVRSHVLQPFLLDFLNSNQNGIFISWFLKSCDSDMSNTSSQQITHVFGVKLWHIFHGRAVL